MNRHIVITAAGIEAPAITEALGASGIEASAGAAHLQAIARLTAQVLAEYPPVQRKGACATLSRWVDEALADIDAAQPKDEPASLAACPGRYGPDQETF